MENAMPANAKARDVLHDDGPPPFSLDQVDKWTPERLDYPWQVEPTGESDIRVGYSQTLVHDDGNGHHGYVGQTLAKYRVGIHAHGLVFLVDCFMVFSCSVYSYSFSIFAPM